MGKKLRNVLSHYCLLGNKDKSGDSGRKRSYSCKYCNWITIVNVTRMVEHIVDKCKKCPSLVRELCDSDTGKVQSSPWHRSIGSTTVVCSDEDDNLDALEPEFDCSHSSNTSRDTPLGVGLGLGDVSIPIWSPQPTRSVISDQSRTTSGLSRPISGLSRRSGVLDGFVDKMTDADQVNLNS